MNTNKNISQGVQATPLPGEIQKPDTALSQSIKRFIEQADAQETYRMIRENPCASHQFFATIDSLNLSQGKIKSLGKIHTHEWINLIHALKQEKLFQHYVRESISGGCGAPLPIHRSQAERFAQGAMGKVGIMNSTLLYYAGDIFAIAAALTSFVAIFSIKPGAMKKHSFDSLVPRGVSLLRFANSMIEQGFTTLSHYIAMLGTPRHEESHAENRSPALYVQVRAVESISQSLEVAFL